MGRRYIFECVDDDDDTTTKVEFYTESDKWSGFDGPMVKFYDFLRGCGFVFAVNAEIGVADDEDFHSAMGWENE